MKRREFITLLGGAAVAWPLAARAQQQAMPVIGFLHPGSPEANAKFTAGFRKGLSETGYVEGRNVAIEYRWAHGENGRLPELAADFISRPVSVIATPGSVAAALAAKAATTTIPIVFMIGVDPVQAGLVVSLNRPGGNVTGITSLNAGLMAKQLGLLHQLLHRDARFAVLVNPNNPQSRSAVTDVQATASAMGQQLEILTATTSRDIRPAFDVAVRKRTDALLIQADPLFANRPVQLGRFRGEADIPRCILTIMSDANDPNRSKAASKSRSAATPSRGPRQSAMLCPLWLVAADGTRSAKEARVDRAARRRGCMAARGARATHRQAGPTRRRAALRRH